MTYRCPTCNSPIDAARLWLRTQTVCESCGEKLGPGSLWHWLSASVAALGVLIGVLLVQAPDRGASAVFLAVLCSMAAFLVVLAVLVRPVIVSRAR